jgi:hypothetical protein
MGSKTTDIEQIHSLFELRRTRIPERVRERIVVEFTGDVERLRQSHFLTLVPVSTGIELLLPNVRANVAPLISSLRPRLQKINTELSVDCRNCEFRSTAHPALDGYRMCWGPLAKKFVQVLAARAERLKTGRADPSEDNVLMIRLEARKAVLDLRLMNRSRRTIP